MKKLLATTALVLSLTASTAALAASPAAQQSYMEKAIATLPKDKAEKFDDALDEAHEQNKDMYEQIHQLHQQLHDILVADTFDANAFTAKSEELRQLHDKMGANLDKAFATGAADLTPAERTKLASAMENTQAAQHAAVKKATASSTAQQ